MSTKGRVSMHDTDANDIGILVRMSLTDEKDVKLLLTGMEGMRDGQILEVFAVLLDMKRYDVLLHLLPTILAIRQKRSANFVRSVVHTACLAAVRACPGGDPSRSIVDALDFDASHLYVDQKAYDAHIATERLGWSFLPILSGIEDELAAKVYRHANVALCIAMNKDPSSDNLVESIKRSLDSGHFSAIVMLLRVYEEAHQGWLTVAYEENAKAMWTTRTWATLLRGLISKHHLQLAQAAWETFNRCKPSTQSIPTPIWNALLTGYADIGDWTRAGQIWSMIDEKSRADTHLITTMIATLFRARRPHEAILHYDQAKQTYTQRKEKLDVAIVNAYLMGLTLNDQADLAIRTLMAMAQQSDLSLPMPNSRSFNVILRTIGRHGSAENLISILGYMAKCDVLPDTVTFTTVLDGLARMGVSDSLPEVYALMQSSGVRVNEVTMTAMIKFSLNDMDRDPHTGLLSALGLLQQMELSGPAPTAVTYTAIMTAVRKDDQCVLDLFSSGRLPSTLSEELITHYHFDRPRRWTKQASSIVCLMLFERMKLLRIEPNRKTLNLLVHLLVGEHARSLADDILLADAFGIILTLFHRFAEPHRPTDKSVIMLLDHIQAVVQQNRIACKPSLTACLQGLVQLCDQDEKVRNAMPAVVDTAARVYAM